MELLNVRYDNLTRIEAIENIYKLFVDKNENKISIFFLNLDCLYKAQKDIEYRNALLSANLVLSDGIGLKLAAKLYGQTIKDNCNGTDLSPVLMEKFRDLNCGIFLLGAGEGVALKAAENLKVKIPGIRIVGTHMGFFDKDEDIIVKINESGAEVLFVAMGVPIQEKWIVYNREKLNPKVCLGVGALFDYLSGRIPRAPDFLIKLKLEWFWRVFIDPGRMFKRYVIDDMCFLAYIIFRGLINKIVHKD